MKKLAICLLILLLLAGCGETPPAPAQSSEKPPSASTEPTTSGENPPPEENPPADAAPPTETPPPADTPSPADAYLSWTGEYAGVWPFDLAVEVLQFGGYEAPELKEANGRMATDGEDNILSYETAMKKGEAQCAQDGEILSSLWAYPVTTERYLSAVTVQRSNMYFRTGNASPWNVVISNYVYDKKEGRIVPLEEMLALKNLSAGDLEREMYNFAAQQNLGVVEKLNSVAFYMDTDESPVFIVGVLLRGPEDAYGWPTFFNWSNGEIFWPGDEPMALGMVDTAQDGLACLQSMGQYGGVAVISRQEAFDTLREIVEVQEYLSRGMSMADTGITEWLNGEEYRRIVLGTGQGDSFAAQMLYAVSFGSVYCADSETGAWIPVGFG